MIYLRERDGLARYLRRRVDPDLAADISQEVFVRAAASERLEHVDNHGGYLCRIAQHILVDRARAYRRRIHSLPFSDALEPRCPAEQEHRLEAIDLSRTIERALALLPEKTRRIFIMHRVDEMEHREIHLELGISVATVKYHMGKALTQIRTAIAAVN